MILNWEMMVGESNTRWHWNTPDDTPEPTIPWDGWMFSDGTPVSYTEAAVMRNWTLKQNDLLHYNKWIPESSGHAFTADTFLTLSGPSGVYGTGALGAVSDYVVETTVWGVSGGILFRASADGTRGYYAGVEASTMMLNLQVWTPTGQVNTVGRFNVSALACGWAMNGWNMLRVVVKGFGIDVYVNPMAPEAYAGKIMPRISWTDGYQVYPDGEVFLRALTGTGTRFDYIGVMPTSVL